MVKLAKAFPLGLILQFLLCMEVLGKTEVFFSPADRPTQHLIARLQKAKKRVYAAVYMLTDKNIALELISARQRGVDVQVVIDKISLESSYGKGKNLQAAGIPLWVYYPKSSPQKESKFTLTSIMHHKFAIIDNELWTGSFNWTRSANYFNQENAIVTDELQVRKNFEAEFTRLKTICSAQPVSTPEGNQGWSLETLKRALKDLFRLPTPAH